MSITERQKALLTSRSPKTRNSKMPDSTWKAQQAFIRATRRGSKKHTSMEQKGQLLDAALSAIPAPVKLIINPDTGKPIHPGDTRTLTERQLAALAALKPKDATK